jgi:predicted transglutaminase-like cysteine proteinase
MTRYDTIKRVNGEVNAIVKPRSDASKYHTAEWWADACKADNEGDCEDYAVSKMRLLMDAGIPQQDLRYLFVRVPPFQLNDPITGEWRWATDEERQHCTLLVSMLDGDLELDNLQPLPVPIAESKNTLIYMQREGGKPGWATVDRIEKVDA